MSKASWILWAVRGVGLLIIAVMAVGVARSPAPEAASVRVGSVYTDSRGEIALAKASDKLNAKSTDNVYQQQVVNGWVARDYLEVQAGQLDKIGKVISNPSLVVPAAADSRPVTLLMWAVLALVWLGLTSPGVWPQGTANAVDAPSTPDQHLGSAPDAPVWTQPTTPPSSAGQL